jgi:hypothetical protein
MVDDLLKAFKVGKAGLRARFKFGWTILIAIIIVAILHVPRLLASPNDVWVPTYGYFNFGLAYWPSRFSLLLPRLTRLISPMDWTASRPARARSALAALARSLC